MRSVSRTSSTHSRIISGRANIAPLCIIDARSLCAQIKIERKKNETKTTKTTNDAMAPAFPDANDSRRNHTPLFDQIFFPAPRITANEDSLDALPLDSMHPFPVPHLHPHPNQQHQPQVSSILESNLIIAVLLLLNASLLFALLYRWARRGGSGNYHGSDAAARCYFAGRDYHKSACETRTAVITGASEGIGAACAKQLALKGWRLVLLCRDTQKARQIRAEIVRENATAEVAIHHIDLESFASIRIAACEVLRAEPRIDALIHCASVAYLAKYEKSADGHERHLAANHYGPFLLTYLLAERIILERKTAEKVENANFPAVKMKVIQLTSPIHRFGAINSADIDFAKPETQSRYRPIAAYAQSKLAAMLAGREWSRMLKSFGVNVYLVNPGFCDSRSAHYSHLPPVAKMAIAAVQRIAAPSVRSVCVTRILPLLLLRENVFSAGHNFCDRFSIEYDRQSGYYYEANAAICRPAPQAMDDRIAKLVWNDAIRVCAIEESLLNQIPNHRCPSP